MENKKEALKGFINCTQKRCRDEQCLSALQRRLLKNDQGITLIALIIIIILLIILSMVGIRGLTGDDKIIATSTKIANEYVLQQNKEYVEQLVRNIILEDILKGEETTLKSLAEELEKDENIKSAEVDEETGTITVITKDGVIVEIYYDEYTGEIHVDPVGEDNKNANPIIKATYNKDKNTIEATASCTDGIESIELIYKNDSKEIIVGKGEKEVTYTFKNIKQEGTYKVKAISNKGKVRYTYVIIRGEIAGLRAPTIEVVTGTKGDNNWYKGQVEIKINGSETGGAKLKYRIVGQTSTNLEGEREEETKTAIDLTQNLTISDIGLTRIIAWVTNEDETKASEYTYQNIKIDNIAPNNATIQVIEGQEGNPVTGQANQKWYISDVKLKIMASDENSGIAGYEYTVTNTHTNKIVINKQQLKGQTKEISIKADGIYKIEVITIDKAGNRSNTSTITLYKDSTEPNEFMPIISGESATGFTIIAYTDDNLSGMDKYKYYVDDKAVYQGPNKQYEFKGEAKTAYGVRVEAYDKAGNIRKGMSTGASTEPEDSTPPVVMVTKGEVTTNSIQVYVTASDQGTGLASEPEYTYYIKKTSEPEYTKIAENIKDTTFTYTKLEQNTEYDIKVEVADGAGNIGAGAIRIITTDTIPDANASGVLNITTPIWRNFKASTTLSTNQTKFELQYKVVKNGQNERDITWVTVPNKEKIIDINNLEHKDKVYARLYDGTNGGVAKEQEVLDQTKPTVTIITKSEEIRNSITFKGTDAESGIIAYKVTKENTEPKEGWVEVEQTLTLSETTVNNLDYNTNYYVWIKDKAGNAGSNTIKTIGEFTVTYNYTENGGTSSTETSKRVIVDQQVDLSITATKSGWTFVGWNTNKDATTGLSSYVMPANDITLYAIYSKEMTVTYHTYNNQTTTETVKLNNKQTTGTIALPIISNVIESGVTYTPRGWSTENIANAITTAPGTSITVTDNLEYYASYQTTVTTTIYYNSNRTSGQFTSANTTVSGTRYMNYTGTKMESNLSIPTSVTGSVGKYNGIYRGVANSTNSMSKSFPSTGIGELYAVYSSEVRVYHADTLTTVEEEIIYRNEFFVDGNNMGAVLTYYTDRASDDYFCLWPESGYSLYGYSRSVNSQVRDLTSTDELRDSGWTVAYAIHYKSDEIITKYHYYYKTSWSGYVYTTEGYDAKTTYVYPLNTSSATNRQTTGFAKIPSEVTNSRGAYGGNFYRLASSPGTVGTITEPTAGGEYYASYQKSIVLYYPQTSGSVSGWSLWRNEWFASEDTMSSCISGISTGRVNANLNDRKYLPIGYTLECFASDTSYGTLIRTRGANRTQLGDRVLCEGPRGSWDRNVHK